MHGLDLFSGIGGLSEGLKSWVTPVVYCERDPYAQAVLLQRMATGELPRAPIWDDVSSLNAAMLPSRIDIVYGGFPCQDISAAGRGEGLDGQRTGLYWQMHRLILETRPRFVFLENVPAIRTRGLNVVAQSLTELGYDCRWTVVSAAEVGAPHLRKRWFLLAHTNSGRRNPNANETDRRQADGTIQANGPHDGRDKAAGQRSVSLAHASDDGARRREQFAKSESGSRDRGWWAIEPNVGRVANGVPLELDALNRLGIPLAQEYEGKINAKGNGSQSDAETCITVGKVLRAMWDNQELATASPDLYADIVRDLVPNMPQGAARKRGNMGSWVQKDERLRSLWPAVLADDQREDLRTELFNRIRAIERTEAVGPNRVDRLRCLGNAVVPLQAKEAFERLLGL